MRSKFPSLWVERMGSSCYDHNGNLTSKAQGWAHEIALLTSEMVKVGLRDLSHLPNPEFPPSAITFVKHCRDRFFFVVQEEILNYLANPTSDYEWSGLVAYNVYSNLHATKFEPEDKIRIRIEKVYNGLSWHDLKPIPDYSTKALPEKRDLHPINYEKGYMQYAARVHSILRANSDTLESLNNKVSKVFPMHTNDHCLLREWWPEFKTANMTVGDFLRDKGLNLPNEPNRDDPMAEILGLARMVVA